MMLQTSPEKRCLATLSRTKSAVPLMADKSALVSAAPFQLLCEEIDSELRHQRRRAPHSDLVSALASFREDLQRALAAARLATVFVSVDQVHVLSNRAPSTITRLCRKHGEKIGAQKIEGAWMINWPVFESFLSSSPPQTREDAA
jgi:hypothetical protein